MQTLIYAWKNSYPAQLIFSIPAFSIVIDYRVFSIRANSDDTFNDGFRVCIFHPHQFAHNLILQFSLMRFIWTFNCVTGIFRRAQKWTSWMILTAQTLDERRSSSFTRPFVTIQAFHSKPSITRGQLSKAMKQKMFLEQAVGYATEIQRCKTSCDCSSPRNRLKTSRPSVGRGF